MDHLHGTPNLVIYEANRLLAQSFQDWLAEVLSIAPPLASILSRRPTLQLTACTFTHLDESQELCCWLEGSQRSQVFGRMEKLIMPATLREHMIVGEALLDRSAWRYERAGVHEKRGEHGVW